VLELVPPALPVALEDPLMLERLGCSVILPVPESEPLVLPVAEQPTRIPNIDARAVPLSSFMCMSVSFIVTGKRPHTAAASRLRERAGRRQDETLQGPYPAPRDFAGFASNPGRAQGPLGAGPGAVGTQPRV